MSLCCTGKQAGWALRAVADNPAMGSAALLFSNNTDSPSVRVMSEDHYRQCFPTRAAATEDYRRFFQQLGCDLAEGHGDQSIAVPTGLVRARAPELAGLML